MRHSALSPIYHNSTRIALRPILPLFIALAFFSAVFAIQGNTLHAQTPNPDSPEHISSDPVSIESNPLEGTFSENQAQGIDRMIMCPVCPAETIDQAQVEISRQMRKIIRQMLSQGSGRDEILDFFVDRYGKDILAAPPKSGANLVAWLMPIGGVLAGLIAVYLILRSMTRKNPILTTDMPMSDTGLIPYLQLVDHLLVTTRNTISQDNTSGHPDTAVQSHSGKNIEANLDETDLSDPAENR